MGKLGKHLGVELVDSVDDAAVLLGLAGNKRIVHVAQRKDRAVPALHALGAGDDETHAASCLRQVVLEVAVGPQAVLGEVGQERIANSDIEELVSTDSTPYAVGDKVTAVSVAELLGEAIRRIHLEESVTSLFDIS